MMKIRVRRGRADERGSMPMALLVTLVAMSLTATLVPVVISQIASTRVVSARTESLDAAQAGVDAGVGQLRAAALVADPLKGRLEELPPCLMTGTQVGLRYSVNIAYYGLPDNPDDTTPVLLSCPPLDVPVTAVLTATGTGLATGALTVGAPQTRTIQATYTFKTNNENITGGAIVLAAPTTNQLCMDGGADSSPAVGTPVKMQLCKAGGSSDQRFAYTTDLNVKLVGSETTTTLAGMCLDAPTPHANGGAITFQPCLGRTARQQWSLDNSSNFRGTADGVNLENFCINLKNAGLAGSVLVIGGCGGTANQQVFRPQTGTGAGMASVTTNQLVNFKQFSRCLDVTNHVVTSTYLIVWYCKQAPDGNLSWNQKWTAPAVVAPAESAVGRIRTLYNGDPNQGYCLRAPDTTAGYVTLTSCTATGTLTSPQMEWTVYGKTQDYAAAYRIRSKNGYCLTPTDLTVASPDTHGDGTAKVKIAPCSAAELQKWNAPANLNKPLVLTDVLEK